MIKLLERQLHVPAIVQIAVIVTPIMPREKSEKVDTRVNLVVFEIMGVQYGYLDELVQGSRFPKHKQHQQIGQYAFHFYKGTGRLPLDQVINPVFNQAHRKRFKDASSRDQRRLK